MAKPTTRALFKDYCLRRLGYPVITVSSNGRINVVTTQVVTDPSAIAFAIALG